MNTKYTQEVLQEAVDNSTSFAGVLRFLGLKQAGGTQSHLSRRIKSFGIDTSHFNGKGWNRGGNALNRKTAEEILIVLPHGSARPKAKQLRRAMVDSGIELKCECGLTNEWNGKALVLEVDHIDGDWLNNQLNNLRFLCPNCHSQQATTNRPHKNMAM